MQKGVSRKVRSTNDRGSGCRHLESPSSHEGTEGCGGHSRNVSRATVRPGRRDSLGRKGWRAGRE